jgi:DNA polymerase-3 subunit beta
MSAVFTIESAAFAAALREIRGAVHRRNTIAILAHVLVEATEDGHLTLSATDLDILVRRRVPAEVERAARFTVDAHRLADMVGAFEPGSQTRVTLADGAAVVSSGRARVRFATLKPDEFPTIAQKAVNARFDLPPSALRKALAAVRHAVSTEETRYYLNGVLLHVADGKLRFVATDGHRLARSTLAAPAGAEGMPDIIVRRAALNMIAQAAEAAEAPITLAVGDDKITLSVGDDFTLVAKAVDGTFPDYTRVIPSGNPRALIVERASLDGALARVGLATSDRVRLTKVAIERDLITVSVTSPEHGEAVEGVPCDFTGERLEIGFNLKYMRDSLAATDAETVEFALGDAATPALITARTRPELTLVLMPMRV